MTELHQSLLIDLAAGGQEVAFDCSGYSVGTIEFVLRSGAWGGGTLEVVRGNESTQMKSLESPITVTADGITMTLDISSRYIGVRVSVAGGPGVVRCIARVFNS